MSNQIVGPAASGQLSTCPLAAGQTTYRRRRAIALSVFALCAVVVAVPARADELQIAESNGTRVKCELEKPQEYGGFNAFAFSPDGKTVAGGIGVGTMTAFGKTKKFGGDVVLWDAESGKLMRTLGKHDESVRWLRYSNDGRRLISISPKDQAVKVWNPATGKLLREFKLKGEYNWMTEPVLAPSGRWLVNVQREQQKIEQKELPTQGQLTVWDVDSGEEKWSLADSGIRALAISTDNTRLAGLVRKTTWYKRDDGEFRGKPGIPTLTLWNLETGEPIWRTEIPYQRDVRDPSRLAFLSDGKTLAGINRTFLVCWDAQTGEKIDETKFAAHSTPRQLALSSDGTTAAVPRHMGQKLELWNMQERRPTTRFTFDGLDMIWNPAFSPDLRFVACGQHGPVILDLTTPPPGE